jgi:caffeoyl-CoA O-methyltransferase
VGASVALAHRYQVRMHLVSADIERYVFDRTRAEPAPLPAISDATAKLPGAQMLTGRVEGRLLTMLAALIGARRALELGTFTGYSALSLAEGCGPQGSVVTCELDPTHAEIARGWFARSPIGSRIELRLGPALETLAGLPAGFDIAFIDADKENYPAYYEHVLAKLRPGGLMVLDNMLWSGGVLAPTDAAARALDALNRTIEKDARVDNVLLTVRDGVHLVRKR